MAGHGGGKTAVVAALLGNLGIAAAKFVAFGFTRSSAMLAEGFHSLADTGNQALMLLGLKLAARPPDDDHPYGYGKETYFWSFVVAMSIFTLGAAFAIYEGIHKLIEISGHEGVHELRSQTWALAVLGVSLGLEAVSFAVAMRAFAHEKGTLTLRQAVVESRAATVITVLFEDAAALLGLVLALVGVGLTALTGNPVFDALASLAIGAVLACVAFFLAAMTKRLLIGQSATPRVEAAIRAAIEGLDGVDSVIELKTLHMGADYILLNLGVDFAEGLDTGRMEALIDAIEDRVKAAVPAVRRIFIEADTVKEAVAQQAG